MERRPGPEASTEADGASPHSTRQARHTGPKPQSLLWVKGGTVDDRIQPQTSSDLSSGPRRQAGLALPGLSASPAKCMCLEASCDIQESTHRPQAM